MSARRTGTRAGGAPGHVRIVGGDWRGTRLPVADAPGLRPTSDRVRETLFNWLQPVLPGARVLDLFAGTGALGLEALSRGAREAWLVERDPRLAEALRATVARLHAGDRAQVAQEDALAWLRAPLHGRFDVVFLDPPFAAGLWNDVLAALGPWVAENAWLYLEASLEAAPRPPAAWALHREGSTRDVRYALYRRSAGAAATLAAGFPTDDDAATE
jgi:16S rRNA (guanine966-N2)-methyltransferase